MKGVLSFILFFILSHSLLANESAQLEDVEFTRPSATDFITLGPKTLKRAWDISFSKDSLAAWGIIVSSTLLLYQYDEEILAEVKRWGRDLGVASNDHTKSFIKIGDFNIFRGPTDLGSFLYFLGDGWMQTFIASGFVIQGLMTSDNRAIQTGSQILHGMIYGTIPNQIAKRSFGRESPYRKTTERGAWNPFPSFSTYNNNISKYDAMPSGHVMAATVTWTVIDENYPEYRHIIRPIAYTWLTLLSLQMVNNGVHWASDYPLGIAMGYVFGKAAAEHGRRVKKSKKISTISTWQFLPYVYGRKSTNDRLYGMNAIYSF